MSGTNTALRDRVIRHALATAGYSRQLTQDIVRLLNSVDQDILAKLAAGLVSIEERGIQVSARASAQLEALLIEVRATNSAIYAQLHDRLETELQAFASTEGGFHTQALNTSLPEGLPAAVYARLPAPATIRAIVTATPMQGRFLKEWTAGMAEGRAARITQAVRLGMMQGESVDQMVRRIRGTQAARYKDGVLEISRRSAESIVRTSVTHVSNQASQQTWRENEHIVKGWQFLATLDSRTTLVCGSNDGKQFPVGQGPIPPLHIRCRSISTAVTKSFRELGLDRDEFPLSTRASMDGQVSAGTTFEGWLRGKDASIQDKVLGKARAELWRERKLSLDDFVRNGGQLLTLDQLCQVHKSILQ